MSDTTITCEGEKLAERVGDISPVEYFWNRYSHITFERFVFGMSHSHGGLLECMLKGKTYKFSAPSMDLYYHFLVLRDVCEKYDMNSVKQVVFELPYYIFNYDVSKCKNTFELRINYFSYYGDYHHYDEEPAGKNLICEYEKKKELLGAKKEYKSITPLKYELRNFYLKWKYYCKNEKKHVWTEDEEKKMAEKKPHVWYKLHEDTIVENIQIWQKILELLAPYKNLQVKVCVFPFCPLFIEQNQDAINDMKNIFEENIGVTKEQYIDLFSGCITEKELFDDECHLNFMGKKKLSKYLRNLL